MAEANYINTGTKRLFKAGTQSVTVGGITTVYPNNTDYEPGDTVSLCEADVTAQGADRVTAE